MGVSKSEHVLKGKRFGEIIREKRLRMNKNIEEMAKEINLKENNLREIELGERLPNEKTFNLITNFLGIEKNKDILFLKILEETFSGTYQKIITQQISRLNRNYEVPK